MTKVPAAPTSRFPPPRPRAVESGSWATAAEGVLWALSLFSVMIWVRGGGVAELTRGFGPFISTVGNLIGFLAAYVLLLQVLLMARIPFLERGIGRDVIVAWHRKFGFWSFWLVLAHIVLLAIGYTLRFGGNPVSHFVDFITAFPGMWLALIGTLLIFIPVILFSVASVRRRFSYEAWHWWHLISFLAVVFVLPHMVRSGSSFAASQGARVLWYLLWFVVLGCVLVFRVLYPLVQAGRSSVQVAEVIPDGSRGVTVKMRGRDLARLGTRAGQFFNFTFLDGETGAPAARLSQGNPFSLSMPPTDSRLQIAVRVVGDDTRRIAELKPGTPVLIEGPYGRVTGDLRHGHRLLMFGAGAGVGPMVAILGDQQWTPGEATLVTRDNTAEETMMVAEIEDLVRTRGLRWIRLIGPIPTAGSTWLPPAGPDGVAPDGAQIIQGWLGDNPSGVDWATAAADTDVYLCGPPIWMTSVARDLDRAGIDPEFVHTEEFEF